MNDAEDEHLGTWREITRDKEEEEVWLEEPPTLARSSLVQVSH